MPETFLTFDFGTNEDAAQQARHKLDGWKQAFRLDKKLLFKFDRGDAASPAPEQTVSEKTSKAKGKAEPEKKEAQTAPAAPVKLLVRLYFSDHEKLSAQRWVQRIPAEEPFKAASPRVVHHGDADFAATSERYQALS